MNVVGAAIITSCLGLAALLHDLAGAGSQMAVATHSPILAAIPFLRDPQFFFRHLW